MIRERSRTDAPCAVATPGGGRRILALETGGERLLDLLAVDRPDMAGIGLDVSERMLQAANARFRDHGRIELLRHDLAEPLPALGRLLVRDPPPGARPEALALLEVARDALLIGVKPAGTALAT